MHTYADAFERKARALIHEEIETAKDNLTHGMDHEAYIRAVGRISGLRVAIEILDETHKLLMNA